MISTIIRIVISTLIFVANIILSTIFCCYSNNWVAIIAFIVYNSVYAYSYVQFLLHLK